MAMEGKRKGGTGKKNVWRRLEEEGALNKRKGGAWEVSWLYTEHNTIFSLRHLGLTYMVICSFSGHPY